MKLPIQTSKYWHSYCCMSVFTVNSICIILKMCHAVIVWDLSLFLHSGCARWECRRKSVFKPPWCGNAVTFTQKINKGNIVLGHLCTYWKMSHPLFWFSSALFDVSDFFFVYQLALLMWCESCFILRKGKSGLHASRHILASFCISAAVCCWPPVSAAYSLALSTALCVGNDDKVMTQHWLKAEQIFRFCVISLTQKSDLIWMCLWSLSTSNLWNKIHFLYFNLLWQFCQHWTAYWCLFSCHAGLSLPENQRHVRNPKDQQRQLLGAGRGTLIKQYVLVSYLCENARNASNILTYYTSCLFC